MNISTPRGQYREVADAIRSAVLNGEYSRGSALPREDILAARLGVSRTTINRALRVLTSEGLVRAIRGEGTFVNSIPPIRRAAVTRYSRAARERSGGRGAFDAELSALGLTPRSDLTVSRATPPPRVAAILGTPDGETVIVRARRMWADDTAVQLADSYIPSDIAAGTVLEEVDSGPGGMVSRLAELGHAQVRITEQLSVRTPTSAEASFLSLTEDQRVYDVVHVGWTAENRPVEVCLHVMPTHQWVLDYEWSADPE